MPAVITIIITIVWYAIVYDTPAQHPRISTEEREHIEKSLGDNISKKKVCATPAAPFKFSNDFFVIEIIYAFGIFAAIGDATIPESDDIVAIHCAGIVALRQSVGTLLFDHSRAEIHERSARIQFGAGRHFGQFTVLGTTLLRLYVRSNR